MQTVFFVCRLPSAIRQALFNCLDSHLPVTYGSVRQMYIEHVSCTYFSTAACVRATRLGSKHAGLQASIGASPTCKRGLRRDKRRGHTLSQQNSLLILADPVGRDQESGTGVWSSASASPLRTASSQTWSTRIHAIMHLVGGRRPRSVTRECKSCRFLDLCPSSG